MRNLLDEEVNRWRLTHFEIVQYFGSVGDHETGMFLVPSPIDGAGLKVLASAGDGWDHVSVSRPGRVPHYEEMRSIKKLFFKDEEVAMELHVPSKDHVNVHSNCLHLWRPHATEIPLPPKWMIG